MNGISGMNGILITCLNVYIRFNNVHCSKLYKHVIFFLPHKKLTQLYCSHFRNTTILGNMANEFEEIRSSKGALYKLRGKLSDSKEANVTVVLKTKLVYMHIDDSSNAYENEPFDKNKSRFVSLSLQEAY